MKSTSSKNKNAIKKPTKIGADLDPTVKPEDGPHDSRELFFKELSDLVAKHGIMKYAGVFSVDNQDLLIYHPDLQTAGRVFNKAYKNIREQVLMSIGEDPVT